MQRTIEILLVIGVLVNLIKGSELVLRPHQEKWLQNKFETLVLWFEYARPIDWLAKREGTVYRTLFVLLVTLFLIGTLVLIINPKNGSWWELILITFIAIVWGLEQAMKTIKDDSRFARWLFQNLPIRQRLGRHIAISILVITSLVLFLIMFVK